MSKEIKYSVTLLILCLLAFAAGLRMGFENIPFTRFFDETGSLNLIISMRATRLAAAFAVGGSLALSGLIFQAVLRNVLAEPFTLGVSGGASLGAVAAYMTGLYAVSTLSIPIMAFAGAMIVLTGVLAISGFGRGSSNSLLLSGVIAGTVCGSLLMYLVSIAKVDTLAGITYWMLGDLDAPDTRLLCFNAFVLVLCAVFSRIKAGSLDALSLGDEQAFYLGTNPRKMLVLFVGAASLLAAASAALAGIISFCGLIVPHIVRRLCGAGHRKNTIPTVLAGGLFLMVCDTAARSFTGAREMPVGVASAIIGGAFFLYILNRKKSGV